MTCSFLLLLLLLFLLLLLPMFFWRAITGRGVERGDENKNKNSVQRPAREEDKESLLLYTQYFPNQQLWHAYWKLGRNTHTLRTRFSHVWHRFACSDGAYQQKFLRRTSLGSLSRVRCWSGCLKKQEEHGQALSIP